MSCIVKLFSTKVRISKEIYALSERKSGLSSGRSPRAGRFSASRSPEVDFFMYFCQTSLSGGLNPFFSIPRYDCSRLHLFVDICFRSLCARADERLRQRAVERCRRALAPILLLVLLENSFLPQGGHSPSSIYRSLRSLSYCQRKAPTVVCPATSRRCCDRPAQRFDSYLLFWKAVGEKPQSTR